MNEPTRIGEYSANSAHVTPRQALEIAISDIDKGIINPDKILILHLDVKDEQYNIFWQQAQMRMSECVSLVEAAKMRFLQEMRIIPFDE